MISNILILIISGIGTFLNFALFLSSFLFFIFYFFVVKKIPEDENVILKQKTIIFLAHFVSILIVLILAILSLKHNLRYILGYSIKSLNFWLFAFQWALLISSFILYYNLFSNFICNFINGNIKNPSYKFNTFIKEWSSSNDPLTEEEIITEIGKDYWKAYIAQEGTFIPIREGNVKKYCLGHKLLNLANILELQQSNKLLKKINVTIFIVNIFLLAIAFCGYWLSLIIYNEEILTVSQGTLLLFLIILVVSSGIFAFWNISKK